MIQPDNWYKEGGVKVIYLFGYAVSLMFTLLVAFSTLSVHVPSDRLS